MKSEETPLAVGERRAIAEKLLREVEIELRHSRVFLTSREKMHPCGVQLYEELLASVSAFLSKGGERA